MFAQLIKDIGSWSVGGILSDTWSLASALAAVHSYGAAPLFLVGVLPDFKNSSRNIVMVGFTNLLEPCFRFAEQGFAKHRFAYQ